MALTPSTRAGQSVAPTQFELQGYSAPNYVRNINIVGSENPNLRVAVKIQDLTIPFSFTFPTDLPKYHVVILESELGRLTTGDALSSTLRFLRSYRLPFPSTLTDAHRIQYDAGFNGLSLLGQLGRILQGAAAPIVQQATGLQINNYKAITMSAPEFRSFGLSWKLAPKTHEESKEIQKIITSLKRGMSPKGNGYGVSEFLGLNSSFNITLSFPHVFTVGLIPNSKFLYKMKPAVIESLTVDFQGGQSVPAFYRSESGLGEDSPPESVTLAMNFIELEYWLQGDYDKVSDTGEDELQMLPSADPFDATNWYRHVISSPTPPTESPPLPPGYVPGTPGYRPRFAPTRR